MIKKIINSFFAMLLLISFVLYGYYIYLKNDWFWLGGLLIIGGVLFNWYLARKIKSDS